MKKQRYFVAEFTAVVCVFRSTSSTQDRVILTVPPNNALYRPIVCLVAMKPIVSLHSLTTTQDLSNADKKVQRVHQSPVSLISPLRYATSGFL